jgi:hypothetical protein
VEGEKAMINNLGKSMVFLNLAFSLVFAGWAVAIYFEAVDWGFKEPRKLYPDEIEGKKETNVRTASEIDKRIVVVGRAAGEKQRALVLVEKAEKALQDVEPHFYTNHLLYRRELETLRTGKGAIDLKDVRYDAKGNLVLSGGLPKKAPPPWGPPELKKVAKDDTGANRSIAT